MTYEEAIQAMKEGKRVKARGFTRDEYFEMQHGVITCEMGYNMTGWYKGHEWQKDGWSIVEHRHEN
ncbi:TPA: hypothetical protein SIF59_003996 [Escherichia coli]|nr:hypothetical protein [Escherichia coli]HEI0663009.1 hypothetical protein [Escherichia coli]